jgi:hypothetical protein
MTRHFPYVAAVVATLLAGAITSAVWAAQAPGHALLVQPPPAGRSIAVINANTPGSPGFYTPGNIAQIVGVPGNPAGAQPPGLTQASQYVQPSMNQAGQPPFGEMLYSMQTYMTQPGAPDFYGTFNPTVVQANEGVAPTAAYPNPATPQTGLPAASAAALGRTLSLGTNSTLNTVGFYNGFGPGQPDFGFYSGFTTPR